MSFYLTEIAVALWAAFLEWLEERPKIKQALPVVVVAAVLLIVVQIGLYLFTAPALMQYGSVYGYLKSVTGEPVVNVGVVFVNDAEGVGVTAKTDSSGYFEGDGILPGKFSVAIQPQFEITEETTLEDIVAAKEVLGRSVPLKFQSAATSGITADLYPGSNRFDIDLTKR